MIEIGTRARTQPPPPRVVFATLLDPHRGGARPWLVLRPDEQEPRVLEAREPDRLVWSSLWPQRPDVVVEFAIAGDGSSGTVLRWTLLAEEPVPSASLTGHLRKRVNELVNADLRYSFGQ